MGYLKRLSSANRRLGVLVGLASLLLLPGCNERKPRDLRPCPSVGFELCDILESECQARVYRHSECARDFEGAGMPEVNTMSRADYRAQLTQANKGGQKSKEAREDKMITSAFVMLRLLDPKVKSQQENDIEIQVNSTLAYYSIADKDITLIDHQRNSGKSQRIKDQLILAHEFTHAQQDEAHDLEAFLQEHYDGSTDGYYAWRSLLEAEANLSEDLVPNLDASKTLSKRGLNEKLSLILSKQERFAQSTQYPYTFSLQNFPYSVAYAHVAQIYLDKGRKGVRALFKTPRSTMLDFMRAPGTSPIKRRRLRWQLPSTDDEVSNAPRMLDRLGAWVWYTALLRNGVPAKIADAAALAWRGDAIAVHADRAGKHVAMMWRIALPELKEHERAFLAKRLALKGNANRALFVHGDELVWVVTEDAKALEPWLNEAKTQLSQYSEQGASMPLAPLPRRLIEPVDPRAPHRCHGLLRPPSK